MMRVVCNLVLCLVWASLAISCAADDRPCRAERVAGVDYTICSADPADDIRLFHRDTDGEVYADFDALMDDLQGRGETLAFAMNAGMYHSDRSPVGLYVEAGVETQALVTSNGPGNFHMLPNGVFVLSRNEGDEPQRDAYVMTTDDYGQGAHTVWGATQSGPMLVIDGELHPRFMAGGTSRKIRNGVGVGADGRVHFVKSEDPVNFHGFGSLFRDHLGAENALYLDGTVSRVFVAGERNDGGMPMGPIVGVVERSKP